MRRASLQGLYGHKVLPDSLLNAVNLPAQEEFGQEKKQSLFGQISRICLLAQDRPVPTRFWLFSSCVPLLYQVLEYFEGLFVLIGSGGRSNLLQKDSCSEARALLTLKLLGIPHTALDPSVTPQSDNSRRWQRFLHFYNSSAAVQRLKTAVLALKLTDVALAITAQKPQARPDLRREPTIVRLSKAEVQKRCSEVLLHSLQRL